MCILYKNFLQIVFIFPSLYIIFARTIQKGKNNSLCRSEKNHTLASENGSEDCRNDSRKSFSFFIVRVEKYCPLALKIIFFVIFVKNNQIL